MTNDYKNVFADTDIRIPKAPGELHRKLHRLMGRREDQTGLRPTKKDLVVELLFSHPKLKSL